MWLKERKAYWVSEQVKERVVLWVIILKYGVKQVETLNRYDKVTYEKKKKKPLQSKNTITLLLFNFTQLYNCLKFTDIYVGIFFSWYGVLYLLF